MSPSIKTEALEQLALDIRFGFEQEAELFDSIRDMFYDVEDFDEDWLRKVIAEQYQQHQEESLGWKRPTDFDRLAKAFDELIAARIVCLHHAGHTRQDGVEDCMATIDNLKEMGIHALGYCYYHSQDLARAIDPNIRNLYLGFGSTSEREKDDISIADLVVDTLRKHAFEVNWAGTADQRIEIVNINWQKVPDHENWRSERVIRIMTGEGKGKKPFWKFW
ncbi:hypothetical protein KJS94_06055 [Flavihumibacter rivuli]|uniref:DUF6891 domain-containing protein n=1 Tax=Flavihumibacter rivuli TaxID=2838156 RepID=UPI001BDE29FC|nr:hypothetical protein [Flavihumibacter rivuli]ULQ57760.1 hypothetical protein KJS94_06055 [Flavihumibacter rivuli]